LIGTTSARRPHFGHFAIIVHTPSYKTTYAAIDGVRESKPDSFVQHPFSALAGEYTACSPA
jgi:hypothetical protein